MSKQAKKAAPTVATKIVKAPRAELRKSDYSKVHFVEGVATGLNDVLKSLSACAELLDLNGCYREADHVKTVTTRLAKVQDRATGRAERIAKRLGKAQAKAAEVIKMLRDSGLDPEQIVTKLLGE